VAGADDLGAIWYNPAGIVDAPSSFLLDASWLNYSSDYTRQALTTSATGTTFVQTFPSVHGSDVGLAGAHDRGLRTASATASSTPSRLGIYAPMVPVTSYPMTITASGRLAGTRRRSATRSSRSTARSSS
jgi:long-chain fatty acid transport protein